MDFKKIGITGAIGFVAMGIVGGLTFPLYYQAHFESLAEKFPGVIADAPNMVTALIGGIIYVFVMAIIYDKMGVGSIQEGAITGAWFGAAKWIFINTQWMAMMPNVWELNFVIIDVTISTVMYGISGAAMGWALDRFK